MLVVRYPLSFIDLLTEIGTQKIAQQQSTAPLLLRCLPLSLQRLHSQLRQAAGIAQIEGKPTMPNNELGSIEQSMVSQVDLGKPCDDHAHFSVAECATYC